MVLDSKQMDWAGREGLDTAALKRAKVPIFGKWYFPDLPANEPLVNLSTGQTETFPAGYRAGAVLYVREADLKRAGIGPYKAAAAPAPAPAPAQEPAAVVVAAAPAAAPPRTAPAAHAAPVAPAAPAQPAPVAHAAPAHGGGHGAPVIGAHAAAVHATEHAHPGPHQYIVIALILSIITAVEVWVYYVPALLPFIFPILIGLSIVKFALVVGFFMHLKFDHQMFTWYFGGGLALALATFGGVMVLAIATHGLPPGNGNFKVYPETLVTNPPPASNNPGIAPAGH
jgi:cytochrome c oxidase subunit 4